jgi:OOP family OmpA-OmpF porin
VGTRAQLSEDDTLSEDATIVLGSLGIGVEIALAERWGARVDARMLVGPDLEDAVGAIDGEVLFAVYYDLGQAPGTRRAEPPAPPPLPDDADRDGLDDELDRCPDEAEDTDGHEDDDGCPEREEDVDGDGDGVLGSLDRCPKAQETANSFQDDDGCPDELPAAVQPFSGTIDGITFERGSTRISRSSYPLLDAAARALADNPKLRVVVVGHTDDRGKRERNIEVSLRRAEAVKKYLVKKGIAADRIGTMGLGPDQPIDDNGTKEGRARNRRIEFKLSMEP